MELSVKDRLYLPTFLPARGNFKEFNLKKEILRKIAIGDEERKTINLRENAEDKRIEWDVEKEHPLEVEFSADEMAYLQAACEKISDEELPDEDGFYDNIAEVRADPIYAKASDDEARRMIGEIKYLDKNNDGKITSEDRAIIGDTNPDFIYGLNANLRWKNLTLGLFFQGTHGNDIFNGNLTNIGMSSIANITQDAYDSRWTPENAANARWPRVTTAMTRDMKLSDRYVEDGSYFRLKTINLNYNFGSVIKGISNLSVFGTVTNVFTITGYSWFDPDVNAFGSDASRRGVDIFSYPSSRTYSIGFKLTL